MFLGFRSLPIRRPTLLIIRSIVGGHDRSYHYQCYNINIFAGNGLCTNCEFHTTDHDTTKEKCAETIYKSAGFFHGEITCSYPANLLLGTFRAKGSSNVQKNEMFWSTFMYHDSDDPLVFASMKFRHGADPSGSTVITNVAIINVIIMIIISTVKIIIIIIINIIIVIVNVMVLNVLFYWL